MEQISKYCKVYEAAIIVGVSAKTLIGMIEKGDIKAKKFGDSKNSPYFVERESLAAWTK